MRFASWLRHLHCVVSFRPLHICVSLPARFSHFWRDTYSGFFRVFSLFLNWMPVVYFSRSSIVLFSNSWIFFWRLSLFAWSLSSRSIRLPFVAAEIFIIRMNAFSSSFSPSTLALSTMLSKCWALLAPAFSSFSLSLASFWSAWASSLFLSHFSFSLALFKTFLFIFENLNSEFFRFISASARGESSALMEEASRSAVLWTYFVGVKDLEVDSNSSLSIVNYFILNFDSKYLNSTTKMMWSPS